MFDDYFENQVLQYLRTFKRFPLTTDTRQWIHLSTNACRIESRTATSRAKKEIIKLLLDARPIFAMSHGVNRFAYNRPGYAVTLAGRTVAPVPNLRSTVYPAPSGLYFNRTASGLPDPVDLVRIITTYSSDGISDDQYIQIKVFPEEIPIRLEEGQDYPHSHAVRPYREMIEFLIFTHEVVVTIRGFAPYYEGWNHAAIPVVYINVGNKLFGIPRFLWHSYTIAADFQPINILSHSHPNDSSTTLVN